MQNNIKLFGALLAATLILAGCGKSQTTQTNPTQQIPAVASKTYTNQKYGIELQYPENLKINEQNLEEASPGGLVFVVQIGDNMILSVKKIDKAYGNTSDPLLAPAGIQLASQRDLTISDTQGRSFNDDQIYVVSKNNYQYFLQVTPSGQDAKADLARIVASLKFTK